MMVGGHSTLQWHWYSSVVYVEMYAIGTYMHYKSQCYLGLYLEHRCGLAFHDRTTEWYGRYM